MPAFFYQGELLEGKSIYLSEEESLHCTKVLRLQKQNYVEVLNGQGAVYRGVISGDGKKKVCVDLLNELSGTNSKRDYYLHVAIAPTKNTDRIEWFVEKAVEIGIDQISFFHSIHSERKKIRTDRCIKRAISALKQSKNPILPKINELVSFGEVIENVKETQKFLAFEKSETSESLLKSLQKKSSYFVIVGPEGGFHETEINLAKEQDFVLASLANFTLRTETAGISICSMVNALHLL